MNIIANYHSHSFRCRHAQGTDEQYVKTAIDAGIKILGFSDHCPYVGFDGDFYSSYRMYPEDLEDYCRSITELRERYKDEIEIHIGLETEYYPKLFKGLLDFIKPYGVEYLILGQHYLDDDQYGPWTRWCKSDDGLRAYVDQCIEAMETGLFSYIAHPDIVGYDRKGPMFQSEMRRLCEAAKRQGIPVEINLLGLATGRDYPCEEFVQIAAETGCVGILGRDSHHPNDVYKEDAANAALGWIEKHGLKMTQKIDMTLLSKYFEK